jgi:hypothetical protein
MISHPYLSAEKLMVSAWSLDERGKVGGPWGYYRSSPTQELVRELYLRAWGGTSLREEHSYDAAMALATLEEMFHEMAWASLCGWEHQNPE